MRDVARIYCALKQVVTDYRLDALTVRCFDFVQQHKIIGCFGLAQLIDEGVIAGLKPGSVVVDFGTSLPGSTRMLGAWWSASARRSLWIRRLKPPENCFHD